MFMTEVELEMILKRRLLKRKMNKCAIIIQAFYRMRLYRVRFLKYLERRNSAAIRIQ